MKYIEGKKYSPSTVVQLLEQRGVNIDPAAANKAKPFHDLAQYSIGMYETIMYNTIGKGGTVSNSGFVFLSEQEAKTYQNIADIIDSLLAAIVEIRISSASFALTSDGDNWVYKWEESPKSVECMKKIAEQMGLVCQITDQKGIDYKVVQIKGPEHAKLEFFMRANEAHKENSIY